MPTNFNDSLSTSQVTTGSFREQAYVDDEGKLTGLDKAAEGAAELSSAFVVNKFAQEQAAALTQDQTEQEELYSKARQLKRNIFDAGVAGDEKAELEFQAKLEDLKIAERQGSISGTNSQLRQEAVLKNFVNRFPHLEDRFRKSYSSTRARAEASKDQFKDPIEEGIDSLITEATKNGMSVKAYLNVKQKQQQLDLDMKNLEYKAKLGASIEPDVDDIFQSKIIPLSLASAQKFIAQNVAQFEAEGLDYDGNKAKADFLFRGEQEAAAVAQELNNIIRTVGGNSAVISREFRDSRINQIRNAYKQVAESGVFDSLDTLKAMKRGMEIGTQQGLRELAKFNPLLAEMVKLDPKSGFEFVYKDFNKSLELYKSGRRAVLEQLASDSSANPIDSTRLKYQLAVIDSWGQGELAQDFTGAINDGLPPKPSGDPDIDAAKVSIITKSVLGSNTMNPQQKANAAKMQIKAEQDFNPEYKAPSAVWYKDPVRARTIQTNEAVKKELTKAIDNGAAVMIEAMTPELSADLTYTPKFKLEDPRQPWKAYGSDGGPFSAPKTKYSGDQITGRSANLGIEPGQVNEGAKTIKALNDMYWTRRKMYGPADAENWAYKFINEGTKKVEEEAAAQAESGSDDFDPSQNPDLDLTD